jgi:ribosomal protein S11
VNNSFFNFSFLSFRSKQFLLKKVNFFFRNRFFRKDVLYKINRFILKSGWFDKVYKKRYGIKVKRYRDLHLAVLNFFKNFVFLKIQNSVNNLFLTAVDMFGNTISWMSLGAAGSRNAVKKTDYAVDVLATKFASKLRFFNIRNLHLYLTIKLSRKVKNVLRGFRKMRIRMKVVTVNFVAPHNGLRRSRRRRK